MNTIERQETEAWLKRRLSEVEVAVLGGDGHCSKLLSKFGLEMEPGVDSQVGKLISAVNYIPEGQKSRARAEVQIKFYLGRLKPEVTVDTLRALQSLTTWADKMSLSVKFEQDRRVYITNSIWNYDDPNRQPWDWICQSFDAFASGLE